MQVLEYFSGRDWKGYKFKTIQELLKEEFKEGITEWGGGSGLSIEQWPAFWIYQAKQTLPIQLDQFVNWLTGESTAFESILTGLGVHLARGKEEKSKRW